jgi:hypothetical protein
MIFGGILSQLLDFFLMTVIYRKIINNEDRKVAERFGQAGGVSG